MKKIWSFISYGLVKFFVLAIGWIANVLVVRKLSMDAYGTFSLFLTVTNLASTIVGGWTNAAFFYFGLEEYEKRGTVQRAFWNRNIIAGIAFLISAVTIFIFSKNIAVYVGISCGMEIIIWILLYYLSDFLSTYFLIVGKNFLSNLVFAIPKMLNIILVLVLDFDVKKLILIYLITQISMLCLLPKIKKDNIKYIKSTYYVFKQFFSFSLREFFGFIGLYLINYCDTIIINMFLCKDAVAKYNVAYSLFAALVSFSYVISNFYSKRITNYIANGKKKELFHFFYKERLGILIMVIAGHFLIYFLAPVLIRTLYEQRYSESITILQILLIASVLSYINVFYIIFYNCILNNKRAQIINIVQSIVNVVFDYLIIMYSNSISGAAWGTVISYVVCSILLTLSYEKEIYALST